jgi:protease-4
MKLGKYLQFTLVLLVFLQLAPMLVRSIAKQYQEMLTEKTQVGRMSITGTLTTATDYIKSLESFFKEPKIKAILINMESGGGAAGTSQAIFEEIKELKKKHVKPVIVFAENICASGAYYIACAADSIIAAPSSFIGSIGVYIPHPELREFIEQYKIKYNITKTGTYKAAGNMFTDDTPEQKEMFQSLTDDTYAQFIKDVAASREKLSLKNADEWAQGRIFTGNQALNLGLIDKIGSLTMVEQEIREKAPIVGEIEWIEAPKPSKLASFFENLDAKAALNNFLGLYGTGSTDTAHL